MSRLTSLLVLTSLAVALTGSTTAFFSDTEISPNNQFTAGSVDLTVNGQDNPAAQVSLADLKPDDQASYSAQLRVSNNPSRLFLHINNLTTGQGQQTEPEEIEENGTPKHDLDNYLTYQLWFDNQPVIEASKSVLLSQAQSCYIPLGTMQPGLDYDLAQVFQFDPDVTNWAQGDQLTFDLDFLAIQERNNQLVPDSGTGRVWQPDKQRCLDCSPGPAWVANVVDNQLGTLKNGQPMTNPNRIDPSKILGPNDNQFYSLGKDGWVVVSFDFAVTDQPGIDLKLYEVTFGRSSYPEERADVEVSQDGTNWVFLGQISSEPNGDGINELDLSVVGLPWIRFVKVTDATDYNLHGDTADGLELDAVYATQQVCSLGL